MFFQFFHFLDLSFSRSFLTLYSTQTMNNIKTSNTIISFSLTDNLLKLHIHSPDEFFIVLDSSTLNTFD